MNTSWIIHTKGDPLSTTRQFLHDLWVQSDLEGILVPIYQEGGSIAPTLLKDPEELSTADPYVSVMTMQAAHIITEISRQKPGVELAAVVRPCEARVINFLAKSGKLELDNWLLIGVDCLAPFPDEDFAWRVERIGSIERLTEQSLQFARQGGIAAYRFRDACQACTSPFPGDVDLAIGLLGLPVHQFMMITTRNMGIAERLGLRFLIDGWVWPSIMAQRFDTLEALGERRTRVREEMVDELPTKSPDNTGDLVDMLADCAPCRLCLEACPICSELGLANNGILADPATAERWLAACVQCGLCEEACPKHRPLTSIIGRINRQLVHEMAMG
jgi:ferredoxin